MPPIIKRCIKMTWQCHSPSPPSVPHTHTRVFHITDRISLALKKVQNQIFFFYSFYYTPVRRKWQLTPVFLPGESHGGRSLVGYSPRGHKESDTIELLKKKKKRKREGKLWMQPELKQLHQDKLLLFC